jgi:hypothetical protein
MQEVLHTIGLCPDHLSHLSVIDLIIGYYNEIQSIILKIKEYVR